jgi:hypothetical protein
MHLQKTNMGNQCSVPSGHTAAVNVNMIIGNRSVNQQFCGAGLITNLTALYLVLECLQIHYDSDLILQNAAWLLGHLFGRVSQLVNNIFSIQNYSLGHSSGRPTLAQIHTLSILSNAPAFA